MGCEDGVADWRDLVACGCIRLLFSGSCGWERIGGICRAMSRLGGRGVAMTQASAGNAGWLSCTWTPLLERIVYTDEVGGGSRDRFFFWYFDGLGAVGSGAALGRWRSRRFAPAWVLCVCGGGFKGRQECLAHRCRWDVPCRRADPGPTRGYLGGESGYATVWVTSSLLRTSSGGPSKVWRATLPT